MVDRSQPDRRWLIGGAGALGSVALAGAGLKTWAATEAPDEVLNPVEVTGRDAVPVVGRLPGAQRMYMLPDGRGEFHQVGDLVMTRVARPEETRGSYELMTFRGLTGAQMPRHAHLQSHVALLVMEGDVEVELGDRTWRMLRGDFANVPPGVACGWTMRSDRGRVAVFAMGSRLGQAFIAMGKPASSGTPAAGAAALTPGQLADAAMAGDFQPRPRSGPQPEAVRVTNLVLPSESGPYVLADGGGERFGSNTFCARNVNTGGQFLFLMTEGAGGPGIGAHFHARHTEDFFALDGETAAWAHGQDIRIRPGDFIQAPPRHLHGFRMFGPYSRFVGFLTPGIFETFFTRGGVGRNGVGGRAVGPGVPPQGGGGRPPRPPGGGDMFRALAMSGRGPDGWPLDVHGPSRPLPPQAPLWTQAMETHEGEQRLALLQHADLICGGGTLKRTPLTPQLQEMLKHKPRPETFI